MKSIFCICCVLIDWTLTFQTVLELTDGWYKIKGMIDRPLSGLVDKKKICVGTKLCMFGAELVGSQNPSPPLQVSNSLFFSEARKNIDIHLPHPYISEGRSWTAYSVVGMVWGRKIILLIRQVFRQLLRLSERGTTVCPWCGYIIPNKHCCTASVYFDHNFLV